MTTPFESNAGSSPTMPDMHLSNAASASWSIGKTPPNTLSQSPSVLLDTTGLPSDPVVTSTLPTHFAGVSSGGGVGSAGVLGGDDVVGVDELFADTRFGTTPSKPTVRGRAGNGGETVRPRRDFDRVAG